METIIESGAFPVIVCMQSLGGYLCKRLKRKLRTDTQHRRFDACFQMMQVMSAVDPAIPNEYLERDSISACLQIPELETEQKLKLLMAFLMNPNKKIDTVALDTFVASLDTREGIHNLVSGVQPDLEVVPDVQWKQSESFDWSGSRVASGSDPYTFAQKL